MTSRPGRITLARMMIAVAITALALGGWVMNRRRDEALARSALHSAEEAAATRSAEGLAWDESEARDQLASLHIASDETSRPLDLKATIQQAARDAPLMRARADWHARLRRKYAYAAARPWLPIAADPTDQPAPLVKSRHEQFEASYNALFPYGPFAPTRASVPASGASPAVRRDAASRRPGGGP